MPMWVVMLKYSVLLLRWLWFFWPPSVGFGLRAMAWHTIAHGGISTPAQATTTQFIPLEEKEHVYGAIH